MAFGWFEAISLILQSVGIGVEAASGRGGGDRKTEYEKIDRERFEHRKERSRRRAEMQTSREHREGTIRGAVTTYGNRMRKINKREGRESMLDAAIADTEASSATTRAEYKTRRDASRAEGKSIRDRLIRGAE